MDVLMISEIVQAGISALAFIISIIAMKKGASKKTVKTIETLAEEAKEVADEYFKKQCKKYRIDTQTNENQ